MDLSKLIERQLAADRRRGFLLDFKTDTGRLRQIEEDLIGLFGEVGEFANLIKKIRLAHDHPDYVGPALEDESQSLRMELADAAIYIIRLSELLGGNLEADILSKMDINDGRYGKLG
ncbi:hypothetical protein [Novosphingobium sp. TCA1]|uniref:hypothetical protein n=1 Tax=Novosphingobium sp. TCA1 TaxID=2682474 RepID=UPI00130AA79D|nr:hypothetical protein [Novosphingobium sp. TCA1]GFE76891.1 hypothetical protein NTCA1_45400 [Novosphingobium sp. TCA1]